LAAILIGARLFSAKDHYS